MSGIDQEELERRVQIRGWRAGHLGGDEMKVVREDETVIAIVDPFALRVEASVMVEARPWLAARSLEANEAGFERAEEEIPKAFAAESGPLWQGAGFEVSEVEVVEPSEYEGEVEAERSPILVFRLECTTTDVALLDTLAFCEQHGERGLFIGEI